MAKVCTNDWALLQYAVYVVASLVNAHSAALIKTDTPLSVVEPQTHAAEGVMQVWRNAPALVTPN